MKVLASQEQVDTMVTKIESNITDEDIIDKVEKAISTWKNASQSGYIQENYSTFMQWFADYYTAIAPELLDSIRNENSEIKDELAKLSQIDIDDITDKLDAFVLSKKQMLKNKVSL